MRKKFFRLIPALLLTVILIACALYSPAMRTYFLATYHTEAPQSTPSPTPEPTPDRAPTPTPNPFEGTTFVVYKGVERHMHPYGACYHDLANTMSTGVIEFLKCKDVQVVLVGGLATDYCVKTTVLQLLASGFQVVVNLAACRHISEETLKSAISEMELEGAVIVEKITSN